MVNIKFNTIHIENFLSIGNADLKLNDNGYVSVIGVNNNTSDNASSNGSGKSSIFESIVWVLTGDTMRGTSDVVNANGNDGALVELHMSVNGSEYVLRRTKGHSEYKTSLFISVDGKDCSGKGIRDSEKVLADLLPDLTPSLIGSVIVLGQGLPMRFTNNRPSERKAVLESLSRSDFMIEDVKNRLTERKSVVSDKKRECEDRINSARAIIESTSNRLEQEIKELNEMKPVEQMQDELAKAEERCKESGAQLVSMREHLNELRDRLDAERAVYSGLQSNKVREEQEMLSSYSDAISEAKLKIETHKLTASSLTETIRQKKSIKDVCPTCRQKIIGVTIPSTAVEEGLLADEKASIESLGRALETIEKEKNERKQKIEQTYADRVNESLNRGKSLKKEKEELESLIRMQEGTYNGLLQEVANLKARIGASEASRASAERRISEYEKTISENKNIFSYEDGRLKEYNERIEILSSFSTTVSRNFRGYLLKDYIDLINDVMRKRYAPAMGWEEDSVSFTLNGNNIDILFQGKPYENLSGGERQKIDLAVQLALRDMLCSRLGFSCNILVVDELFDNLDAVGCESAINVISNQLSDISSIFIISHHTADIAIPCDREIIVTKNSSGVSEVLVK